MNRRNAVIRRVALKTDSIFAYERRIRLISFWEVPEIRSIRHGIRVR